MDDFTFFIKVSISLVSGKKLQKFFENIEV